MNSNHIFNRRLLLNRLSAFDLNSVNDLERKRAIISKWKYSIENSDLAKTTEKSVQGDFLNKFFVEILGYQQRYGNDDWNITQEQKTKADGTTADGALGFFAAGLADIRVVIELKDAKTDLDKKQQRDSKLSPVEQAFSYAPKSGSNCHWVIVSNFREIRLYHHGSALKYEQFLVTALDDDEQLKRFLYLLSRANLIEQLQPSLVDTLYAQNEQEEKNITNAFYKQYNSFRSKVFADICANNESFDRGALKIAAQKLLDRLVFVCFAEDNGLLPHNIFRKVVATATGSFDFSPDKIWRQLRGLFQAIDKGFAAQNIPAFNGGLFAPDSILDNIVISDEILTQFSDISDYDFATDVDVDILGHIFEQSLNDFDALGENETISKRKRDGVFYTPKWVTQYIVAETIGAWLAERRAELGEGALPELKEYYAGRGKNKPTPELKAHIGYWEQYKNILETIHICDPACGSGAFLNAAFDYLKQEGDKVNVQLDELRVGQQQLGGGFGRLDESILRNNLFGMDINPAAVEIAKLSLWLKTANRSEKLTTLDDNIICVDSLRYLDSPAAFDVVIGNPPYVRQELLGAEVKAYLAQNYETYAGTADLFVYFFELGHKLLKPGGYFGYISSNKFMKAGYGANLRRYLRENAEIKQIIDFGELPVFADASTFPAIFVTRKKLSSCQVIKLSSSDEFVFLAVKDLVFAMLAERVSQQASLLTVEALQDDGWNLTDSRSLTLMAKIKAAGVPLGEYVNGEIYYGIKTGLNEAFVIDTATKDRLIAEHHSSAEIIKPFAVGDDVRRYHVRDSGKWLILIPSGWTRKQASDKEPWQILCDKYPAIARKLEPFADKAQKRYDQGQYWWELRACDYYAKFEQPKIVWPIISKENRFTFDNCGMYLNDKSFFISGVPMSLVGILTSKLAWWFLTKICSALGDVDEGGRIELRKIYVETFPIVSRVDNNDSLENSAKLRSEKETELWKLVSKTLRFVCQNYFVSTNSKLENWHTNDNVTVAKEFAKQKIQLSVTEKAGLFDYLDSERAAILALRTECDRLDREIDVLVYQLYGLTAEEIALVEGRE